MALSEDRVLASVVIKISDTGSSIDVEWENRVLREGEVVHRTLHRGAYPLNVDGEPDDSVITAMGKTISQLLGEGPAAAQRDLAVSISQNQTLLQQNNILIGRIQSLEAELNQLRVQ